MEELCSLRLPGDGYRVEVIDQTRLPHQLAWVSLDTLPAFCHAIAAMQVRGAPLIGITAAFGLACAVQEDPADTAIEAASRQLLATRPTAVNLAWALGRVRAALAGVPLAARGARAWAAADTLRREDIAHCSRIGDHGLRLLRALHAAHPGRPLQVLTHCNAGALATIAWGTALAPVYKAQAAGLPVHVWVSETRPRNQGMYLTAWELGRAGVPHTLVADNSCGLLLQTGAVDCCLVGSDRTAANGDVCNKVGTYLKALAAHAHEVPFYVALPLSTIDWEAPDGAAIEIEQRSPLELSRVSGRLASGEPAEVELATAGSEVYNPAFDITPGSLVSGLLTEHGVFPASSAGLVALRRVADQNFSSIPT
jgi:methylthioribose-1-phosphate isomerase